jgi:hypothetical protein
MENGKSLIRHSLKFDVAERTTKHAMLPHAHKRQEQSEICPAFTADAAGVALGSSVRDQPTDAIVASSWPATGRPTLLSLYFLRRARGYPLAANRARRNRRRRMDKTHACEAGQKPSTFRIASSLPIMRHDFAANAGFSGTSREQGKGNYRYRPIGLRTLQGTVTRCAIPPLVFRSLHRIAVRERTED